MQMPLISLSLRSMIYRAACGASDRGHELSGRLALDSLARVIILGLMAVGNVCCMVCPFTALGHSQGALAAARDGSFGPMWLRSKWLAVVLVVLFLWAYEAFALWDSPWWTAWIAIAYFVAAFVIDGIFRGAAFCKYVCPIGQFNFVQSLMSPLEVKVRDSQVCVVPYARMHSGRERHSRLRAGNDFQPPHKASNMDCTFCLDSQKTHSLSTRQCRHPGRAAWQSRFGAHRFGLGLDQIGKLRGRGGTAIIVLVLRRVCQHGGNGCAGCGVARSVGVGALPQRSLTAGDDFFVLRNRSGGVPGDRGQLAAALFSRWLGRLQQSTFEVATRFS